MGLIRAVPWVLLLFLYGGRAPAAEQATVTGGTLAVTGGTLVDVESGQLLHDAVILLEGDRILSVTSGGEAPAGAILVDATGKYILPGLIDLHVHYEDWAAELYLNHGVTTVVDLGNVYDWIKAQKDGIASGVIPGPRLFHSPPNLEGPAESEAEAPKRIERIVKNAEDARAAVREYTGQVEAVKVYDRLTVPQLRGIVAEAEKFNVPVIGHFSDVRIAAEVGAHGVEHTHAVANALIDSRTRDEALRRVRRGYRIYPQAVMDLKRLPEIVRLMVDSGLYLNPTMRGNWQGSRALREKGFHHQDFELLLGDWRLRYVPLAFRLAVLKEYDEIGLWNWRDLSEYERELFEDAYRNTQRLVKAFVDAGGKVYAGTDSAHMSTPGLSMHQELELLVDAGLTPLVALQAATTNPAALMRMSDRFGTVAAGKVGDLLLLDENPLADIRNTRKIWRVISRGRVLDGAYHADFKNPLPRNYAEDSSHYFPSPEIRSVTPGTVAAGADGTVVTITGTGFIPYSTVLFDGVQVKTDWLSTKELRADVPRELLRPGTYGLRVENPDFGWGSVSVGSHLSHLGIRDYLSNEFLILVKFAGRPGR